MFYRKTLDIFREQVGDFHAIVNGIDVDTEGDRIMDSALLQQALHDVAIVEAATDAGNSIEGTAYQTLTSPVGQTFGRRYLLINNAPTIMAAEASRDISPVVGRDLFPGVIQNRELLDI